MSSFLLLIFLRRIYTHHVSVGFGVMVGAASMYLFFVQAQLGKTKTGMCDLKNEKVQGRL